MGKLCIWEQKAQKPRSRRRVNGAELPLNWQQVLAWVVLTATAIVNFIIVVEIQFEELRIVSIITYVVLYACHVACHGAALLTDPAETELRRLKVLQMPEFDRTVHAHVIENGRCHLCNIYTTSKRTKHCSLCNKCVDRFDHHCKWLNNCIGRRNYYVFISCVVTAILISVFTCSLCLTDIVLFLTQPKRLSSSAQNFINCTPQKDFSIERYCCKSIAFLVFLITYCVSTVTMACVLLHLYCFHVYISMLGVSTYEYIVKGGTTSTPQLNCDSGKDCKSKPYIERKKQNNISGQDFNGDSLQDNATPVISTGTLRTGIVLNSDSNSHANVTNLVGNLISSELDRVKRIFFYDKNKVHPQNPNS